MNQALVLLTMSSNIIRLINWLNRVLRLVGNIYITAVKYNNQRPWCSEPIYFLVFLLCNIKHKNSLNKGRVTTSLTWVAGRRYNHTCAKLFFISVLYLRTYSKPIKYWNDHQNKFHRSKMSLVWLKVAQLFLNLVKWCSLLTLPFEKNARVISN